VRSNSRNKYQLDLPAGHGRVSAAAFNEVRSFILNVTINVQIAKSSKSFISHFLPITTKSSQFVIGRFFKIIPPFLESLAPNLGRSIAKDTLSKLFISDQVRRQRQPV